MTKISVAEFNDIVRAELPWAHEIGMHADIIGEGSAVLRLPYRESMLRPGGVISGPTIMGLADASMYAALLSLIGKIKMAVTSNFSVNFLYGAQAVDLLAESRVLKLGKRLAVMEVTVHSAGREEPVAHATGTYSIPPASKP